MNELINCLASEQYPVDYSQVSCITRIIKSNVGYGDMLCYELLNLCKRKKDWSPIFGPSQGIIYGKWFPKNLTEEQVVFRFCVFDKYLKHAPNKHAFVEIFPPYGKSWKEHLYKYIEDDEITFEHASCIAGGAIASIMRGLVPNDVDIFYYNMENYDKDLEYNRYENSINRYKCFYDIVDSKYQFILLKAKDNYSAIKGFDIDFIRAFYDLKSGKAYATIATIECWKRSRSYIYNLTSDYRKWKYYQKGIIKEECKETKRKELDTIDDDEESDFIQRTISLTPFYENSHSDLSNNIYIHSIIENGVDTSGENVYACYGSGIFHRMSIHFEGLLQHRENDYRSAEHIIVLIDSQGKIHKGETVLEFINKHNQNNIKGLSGIYHRKHCILEVGYANGNHTEVPQELEESEVPIPLTKRQKVI